MKSNIALAFAIRHYLSANYSHPAPEPPAELPFGVRVGWRGWLSFTESEGWKIRPEAFCLANEHRPVELNSPAPIDWDAHISSLTATWEIIPGFPAPRPLRATMGGEALIASGWNALFAVRRALFAGHEISPRVREWVASRYGMELIDTADGYLCDSNDVQHCELTDETYSAHAEFETYYRRGLYGRRIECQGFEPAVTRDCFFCDYSREWYLDGDFTRVNVDGDTVCFEEHGDNLYYWESDGEYHTEPEPEDNECIPSYHSHLNDAFKSRAKGMTGAGIELEVYTDSPLDLYDHISGYSDLCGEIDPSLCAGRSLEIITVPHSLRDWTEGNVDLFDALETCGDDTLKGHGAGEGYGIHVSLTRSLFASDLHLGKYVVAINQMATLGRTIAQRANSYNGGFKIRDKVSKATGTGKYEPVNVGSTRVETRIFRSNTRKDRIQAKVQYCFAVMAWTRYASAAIVGDEHKATSALFAFLSLPENRSAFPQLCDMIGEKAAEFVPLSLELVASRFNRPAKDNKGDA